jgi:hypothetical protein
MICQQQFRVWVVLPDQKFDACEALGIACRSEQLAGSFDGGGRDSLVAMPPAIPIGAMSCLGRCGALDVDRIAACSLPRRSHRSSPWYPHYTTSLRSRSALAMTETELKVMAALAMMGLKSSPNTG